jgi:hypothetical protein
MSPELKDRGLALQKPCGWGEEAEASFFRYLIVRGVQAEEARIQGRAMPAEPESATDTDIMSRINRILAMLNTSSLRCVLSHLENIRDHEAEYGKLHTTGQPPPGEQTAPDEEAAFA